MSRNRPFVKTPRHGEGHPFGGEVRQVDVDTHLEKKMKKPLRFISAILSCP